MALCAAIAFAVAEPALFLGNLAAYDATALCLLAVAAWLVVRTAAFRWPAYCSPRRSPCSRSPRYASLLFVPSIVVLAGLAAVQKPGRKALIAPVALGVTTAGLLAACSTWRALQPERHQVHDAEPSRAKFRLLAAGTA